MADATKPQTDREWLVQIDGKVDSILSRLEKGDSCMKDYDDRLDALEKFQAKLIGIAISVSLLASFCGYWILCKLSELGIGGGGR